ncbi:MAG: tetratricopeptide repeat protein [Pseudomonadota bacterium]
MNNKSIGARHLVAMLVSIWSFSASALEPPLPASFETIDANVSALVRERVATIEDAPAPDPQALADLAIAYEANNLWALAAQTWVLALSLGENSLWRFHYALCLRESGDLEASLRVLQALAKADPRQPWVQERLGEALFERGDLEGAAAAYTQMIATGVVNPFGHTGLGQVRLTQTDYAGAVASLERAVAIAPTYRQARYMLGLAYRAQGKREQAAEELRRGVDGVRAYYNDPLSDRVDEATVNAPARRNLANTMLATRRPDQAAQVLEKIAAAGEADINDLNNLAVAYLQLGRLEAAENILTTLADEAPEHFGTQLNLVSVAMREQDVPRALEHARRAVSVAPRVARTHQTLARVQAQLRDWQGAAASLAKAEQLDSRDPQLAAMHGDVLVRLGRDSEAATRYAHALSLFPDLLPVQLSLARLHLRVGDKAAARTMYLRAVALAPDHPGVKAVGEALATSPAP